MPELRDAEPRVFVRLALVLLAASLAALAIATVQYLFYSDGRFRLPRVVLSERPPAPRLQTAPREDLLELRRREAEILGTYGWADRRRGLVRVPIDRAIDLLLEQGLPVSK